VLNHVEIEAMREESRHKELGSPSTAVNLSKTIFNVEAFDQRKRRLAEKAPEKGTALHPPEEGRGFLEKKRRKKVPIVIGGITDSECGGLTSTAGREKGERWTERKGLEKFSPLEKLGGSRY